MKFKIENKALLVTAETAPEALEMVNHFNLDALANITAIAAGNLVHLAKPGTRDNSEWFTVSAAVDPAFIAPYMAKLEKVTGYVGPIPTIENAPRYLGGYCVNLCHTHIIETARLDENGYRANGFMKSQDWNGKAAAVRAPIHFAEYLCSAIGDTKHEPQYIRLSNGFLKENPNYLKMHKPHAACTSSALWACIFDWWKTNRATPAQLDVLTRAEVNHQTVCRESLSSQLMREYHGFRTSWESDGLVTFEQFKGL